MSRASRNARYYARRKERIFLAEGRLKTLTEQYQQRMDDFDRRLKMLSEENQLLRAELAAEPQKRLKTQNEQKQIPRQSAPRARVEDESPSTESHGRKKKHIPRSPTGSPEFDAFWALWPNKVCKQKAFESYGRALERVTQAELLDGVRRYIATKPDSQQWCHPSTWLNQDRWTDDPAPPVRQRMNGGGSNYSGLF